MASLQIPQSYAPDLNGKVALITGGSSGIGLAAAQILLRCGATVNVLDINPPDEIDPALDKDKLVYTQCDVTSWPALRSAFDSVVHLDMAFVNAGIGEKTNYFQDTFDESGLLAEPSSDIIDVDFKGQLNAIKLAWCKMKKQGKGGSIVVTTSGTALVPWQSLPVYSSIKLAMVGIVRSLRSVMIHDNITINAVAPSATLTKFIPPHLVEPVKAIGAPVSSAHEAAVALVYSATAQQVRRVEAYGKDQDSEDEKAGRWNGRVILVLGDKYTEVEETYASLRSAWMGRENARMYRVQQAATDVRKLE